MVLMHFVFILHNPNSVKIPQTKMPALAVEAGLCPQLAPCHHASRKPPPPYLLRKQ